MEKIDSSGAKPQVQISALDALLPCLLDCTPSLEATNLFISPIIIYNCSIILPYARCIGQFSYLAASMALLEFATL